MSDKKPSKIPENTISNAERVKEETPVQENVFAANDDKSSEQPAVKRIDKKAIPQAIVERYLKVDNKYHFKDKTVAFIDRGDKLKLDTENREVIKDALSIAEARGWETINIDGTKNFKHQVWLQASLKGLTVANYTPTELQVAELNSIIAKGHKEPEQPKPEGVRGTLLAHGADHYQHNPKNGQSYYVTLDVNGKEVTKWGSDLKRAMHDSQSLPQVGDKVVLKNTGKEEISIPSQAVDGKGNVVDETKTVKKNTWLVEKAQHYDKIHEFAEALRVGKEIERRVIADNPQLAEAIAVSKLGEKIADQGLRTGAIRSQDEADLLVKHINDGLAQAIKDGKKITGPEIQQQAQKAAIEANNVTNDHIAAKMQHEAKEQVHVR
ncbi:hypothetical protein MCAMS1_01745 [biofilm metagenome]